MSGEHVLQRPIYGGVFGEDGDYSLASVPCVSRGLHATRYMVIQAKAGVVLSISEDKALALERARVRIRAANDSHHLQPQSAVQGELWPDEPVLTASPSQARYVSRRRKEIYDSSAGRCHYCGRALDLSGSWHVEHQLPRALGGGDDSMNLVAACAPCNLAKGDATAIEFAARSSKNAIP